MKSNTIQFDKFNIHVSKDVFCPREDIDIYQKIFRNLIKNDRKFDLLELGTGTGLISIAIAKEYNSINVTATDISLNALQNAQENAERNKVKNNIKFIKSNWFSSLEDKKYDIIVSNPPYLSEKNAKHYQNLDDPDISLYSKDDGLYDIFTIMLESKNYLKENSYLVIEHSHNQTLELKNFAPKCDLRYNLTKKDMVGFNRISVFSNFI